MLLRRQPFSWVALVLAAFVPATVRADDAAKPTTKPAPYERLHVLEGHTSIVRSVAFQPGTRRLVSGGSDRSLRVWDAEKGALLAELQLPRSG